MRGRGRLDAHHRAGVRRVDHLSVADVDPHVRHLADVAPPPGPTTAYAAKVAASNCMGISVVDRSRANTKVAAPCRCEARKARRTVRHATGGGAAFDVRRVRRIHAVSSEASAHLVDVTSQTDGDDVTRVGVVVDVVDHAVGAEVR